LRATLHIAGTTGADNRRHAPASDCPSQMSCVGCAAADELIPAPGPVPSDRADQSLPAPLAGSSGALAGGAIPASLLPIHRVCQPLQGVQSGVDIVMADARTCRLLRRIVHEITNDNPKHPPAGVAGPVTVAICAASGVLQPDESRDRAHAQVRTSTDAAHRHTTCVHSASMGARAAVTVSRARRLMGAEHCHCIFSQHGGEAGDAELLPQLLGQVPPVSLLRDVCATTMLRDVLVGIKVYCLLTATGPLQPGTDAGEFCGDVGRAAAVPHHEAVLV